MKDKRNIIFALLAVICIVFAVYDNYREISAFLGIRLDNDNKEDREEGSNEYNIVKDNKDVVINYSIANINYSLGFTLSNIKVSRKLPREFAKRVYDRSILKLDEDVLDDDYTFLKDFYYLYMTVEVTSLSEINSYAISSLGYVNNEDNKMIIKEARSIYKDSYYDSKALYWKVTDGHLLTQNFYIEKFNKGDTLKYNVCYTITDDAFDSNNVYFVYAFGMNEERRLKNSEQKYIWVDLENKYEEIIE
ncbi:MAG: hypothetical protein MR675_02675 [Lachnospira sp.]|nr:hypothetical protein [Lachnospira sp.]